ncbi:selenium-binding family protein [Amycolatopsis albispora]|uniref:selenium-binding family protein n=1 Tax=Amycolatopsis albispora TaxID=1804986 RepID=UPI001F3D8E71|nr:selenium-binding family protein [Amycolatopsis albispora]
MLSTSPRWRKLVIGALAGVLALGAVTYQGSSTEAYADVQTFTDAKTASDGKRYWVKNHLVGGQETARAAGEQRKKWLLVWAGDENIADTLVKDVKNLPGSLAGGLGKVTNALPGPDFLAVIDATEGSGTYGKVVNTATVGPLVENEPHHMQYVWHKGDTIYAGALFAAATYAFDVSALPELKLKGISLPTNTLGGSVPDAYWTLKDGTAYGTYMGGPVVPGPYAYANGQVAVGNGFAGSPGALIRFDQTGKVLSQTSAATPQGDNAKLCANLPQLGKPTCANPHGIQAREDLNTLVTSDYAEPRNIILDPVKQPSPYLRRPTVRTWDITERDNPKLKAVSYLQDGPRADPADPLHAESRAVMETTVTNLPGHKGAFAQTMQGGAVHYTPDITAEEPKWVEVFDDGAANKAIHAGNDANGGGSNGGWIQTSPDDKYLYRAISGRAKGALGPNDPGTTGGVYVLDIQKLLAAGTDFKCKIDTLAEAQNGGAESDCPTVAGAAPINPGQPAAGPHWGAYDNFKLGADGFYHETKSPERIAVSNYFVARSGLDGDHKVNMLKLGPDGKVSLDTSFKDEFSGQVGINFNRKDWPHGSFGNAKPHSELFVIADADVK